MKIQNLKSLVKGGENDAVEFKRKINHPDKVVKEAVAFANSHGGWLLIGVDDSGTFAGVKDIVEEQFAFESELHKSCAPKIKFDVQECTVSDKLILCYYIHEGGQKPYYIQQEDGRKDVYYRVDDRSIKATKELKEILKARSKPKGITVRIGEAEKALLKYIEIHQSSTVEQYKQFSQLPKAFVSRLFIRMTLAGALEMQVKEQADQFVLKAPKPK